MALLLAVALASSTVVLLPLDNRSGAEEARAQAAEVLAARLTKRGYEVKDGAAVEAVLEAKRIRHLDSLAPDMVRRLATELGASAVLSGVVYRYAEGRNASAALSVRLVGADGTVLFWDAAGLTADDTTGLFGRGRAETREALLARAVDRALRGLPAPGTAATPPAPAGPPFRLRGPRTYRAASLDGDVSRRVVLLPLENRSRSSEAGRTATQLLWRRLHESETFDVVEPAVVRAALVAEKVRSLAEVDPAVLQRLAERLGTPLFVRGTVEAWWDESPQGGATSPAAELDLALVDVEAGRLVWTSHHAREGSDYEFLLRRGALTSAVALADRMVSEMVQSFDEARPVAVRAGKETR